MAVSTKIIKRRIKSITSTKKITKAMEMIAAVKMRKAVEAALRTRHYAKLTQELLNHLAGIDEPNCPLLATRPVSRILLIVISSNRGLCGSFNANIFKKTALILKDTANIAKHHVKNNKHIEAQTAVTVEVLGLGRKSALFAKKNNLKLISVYDRLSETPNFEETLSISQSIINEFSSEHYDKVLIAYTDYKSSLTQEPKLRQLLPVSAVDLEKMINELGADDQAKTTESDDNFSLDSYLFEPNVTVIINEVLPKLVEIQLFQAMLESSASEHSARMVAMKNANEAAGEMIDDLTLNYNKIRQAGITQEIAEISAGAASFK